MATSIGVQAVLAGGGQPPPDPRKYISDSSLTKIVGADWRKSIIVNAATYSKDEHGLYLQFTVRNGGAGGSRPGAFLVDITVSNDDRNTYHAMFSLFTKETWHKEPVSLAARDFVYVATDGERHQPAGVTSCTNGHDFDDAAFSDFGTRQVSAGGTLCLRLIYRSQPPSKEQGFSFFVPRLLVGGHRIENTTFIFGARDA